MDISDLAIVAAGLFAAGLVKGLTGIGYSTCALPFLVMAVGLKAAMALVIAPAIASNLAVMAATGRIGATLVRFSGFYLAIIPGIAAGAAALTLIDQSIATKLLAVVTMAYVGLALAKPDLTLPPGLERPLAIPAGLLNGFLTGLTGSQIMPLMAYVMSLKLENDEQVQAVNLAVTFASLVLAAALVQAGIMTVDLAQYSLLGTIPAILGVVAGARLRRRLPASTFRVLTLATLALIAMSLMGGSAGPAGRSCAEVTPASRENSA